MIWRHLGFEEDIFFVTPLDPTEEDIKFFVGRSAEVKEFLLDVFNSNRALKVVSGKIGVGKTTFVNACQYYSYADIIPDDFPFTLPKTLPCFRKIQLEETDDLGSLINKVLIAITHSIRTYADERRITLIDEIKEIVDFFQNLFIRTGGGGITLGGEAYGFGGSISFSGESKAAGQLFNTKEIFKKLIYYVREEMNFEGIFVLINNLDILSKNKIVGLINSARDELFDIEHIYWILVGQEGLNSLIESECERVADYLSGTETKIKPLDSEDLIKIVQKREENLRIRADAICPLNFEEINTFHDLSLKELRGTFRICGEVVKRVISKNPALKQIPREEAISAFFDYANERAKDLNLTEHNVRILTAVYKKQEVRPKDYAEFGYQSSAGFISALQSLVKKRLLVVEEKGKARIYTLTGMTIIAGITGALGPEIQDVARSLLQDVLKQNHGERFRPEQLSLIFIQDED